MPDKNSGGGAAEEPLPPAGLSYVVCGEPLLKAEFLDGLARRCGSAVYIDLDMMRSGFLRAGTASAPAADGLLHIAAADGAAARRALGRAVSALSAGAPTTVLIDTLNGMRDMAGGERGGDTRADAAIMMLAMAAAHTSSRVVVACIAERRGAEWRLRPGGRRLPVEASAGGAAWLRIVRGDRPGGGEEIALEPIAAEGRAPHAASGSGAPNGVMRAPNGVIIGPSRASYISNSGGQGAQCQ